jgi:drug/metabolite transporter (DMT)-like permease
VPLAVTLALASALAYGVSDWFAAVATRRLGLLLATTLTYVAGTAAAGAGLLVIGGTWSWPAAGWGAAASLATVTGLLAFYRAMVIGPVSLVSPLIAVLQSAFPVAVAAVAGDRFGGLTWFAIALAVVAGVLMSSARGGGRVTLRTFAIALLSGTGLGLSVVFLDRAPAGAGQVPAFADLAGGLVVLLALLAVRWRRSRPALVRPRQMGPPAVAGVLMGAANVLLVLGLQKGELAVVGVLVSLYPLATIVLARLVDRERPSPAQWAGVGAALVASMLFAAA